MTGHDGDDSDSLPDLDEVPPHLHPHHNPWQSDDPEEADISNVQFIQTAPGRYNLRATYTGAAPQDPTSMGGFAAMLNGLVAGTLPRGQGPTPGGGAGLFSGVAGSNPDHTAREEPQSRTPHVSGGRFTYHGGARVFPGNGNNPTRTEPVDEITNVMTGLMAALGAPAGAMHAHNHPQGGAQGTFRGEHNHEPGAPPFAGHPIFQLFSNMGMMGPAGGNMGDFVYSQEGLDRIVTQLMEQNATSNAPGPAPQVAIDSLPRKKVTEEMLGEEHKAECSICMDEVNIGEQVTELPCKHWFHHQCVSAWLLEHDTCPHCRKGITKGSDGQANNPASPSGREDRTSQMPGAFTPSRSGSSALPTNDHQSNSSDNANAGSGNGGISDRIRRGLFGSPQ
jgi:E3 ubiquitin-protein ligase RNF115/126